MLRESLTKKEVINAIERKSGSRVPLFLHKWWGDGLEAALGPELNQMAETIPDDICVGFYRGPGLAVSSNSNPSYRLGYRPNYQGAERHGISESVVLMPDWSELQMLLDEYPDPHEPGVFDQVERDFALAGDRYKIGGWWLLFHERLWAIRGMENLMLDYYDQMDSLKIIGRKILDCAKVTVDRYHAAGADGIFSSDDLGHQTGPMMSPAIFEELYFPLYKELISYIHSKGMHFWLHSCGDNSKFMEYFIEAGLDVFHPVQRGCMNEVETVKKYGGRISFLAGVDVQHLLPEGTVAQVREGVRKLIDTFHKTQGGLLLAMGNGIMPGTPLENIEAALQEMTLYAENLG